MARRELVTNRRNALTQSRVTERMLTVSESLRAQDRSILEFLKASIRARLTGGARPSLLPPAQDATRLSA